MNSTMRNWIIAIVVIVVLVVGAYALTGMGDDDATTNTNSTSQQAQDTAADTSEADQKDIVALASDTANLSTLVSAVQAADLVSTLQGEGPFTVFAPTNEAFAALPAGTLDTLLKPESKETLAGILTYHVIPGKVMSADLKDGQEVTTVQGGKLTVKLMDNKVYLVDAKGSEIQVTTADVEASNGIVHIIGGVLMPN